MAISTDEFIDITALMLRAGLNYTQLLAEIESGRLPACDSRYTYFRRADLDVWLARKRVT